MILLDQRCVQQFGRCLPSSSAGGLDARASRRLRRSHGDAAILELLRAHTAHANAVTDRTLAMARAAMRLQFAK
jgi:hypothetical protein